MRQIQASGQDDRKSRKVLKDQQIWELTKEHADRDSLAEELHIYGNREASTVLIYYSDWKFRKQIIDKIAMAVGKKGKEEELSSTDFKKATSILVGIDHCAILRYYKIKFCLKTESKAMDKLVEDLYNKKRLIKNISNESFNQRVAEAMKKYVDNQRGISNETNPK